MEPANTEVTYQGHRISLETHLWRDFMPGPEPPKGMNISVNLVSAGAPSFPEDLTADSLVLVKGREIWKTSVDSDRQEKAGNMLRISLNDGPTWAAGDIVTVIVTVKAPDTTLRLQKSDVPIDATY